MKKKTLILLAVLMTALSALAENTIYYTSTDGNVVEPNNPDVFGANIVSNTYEDGQGMIVFDGEVTEIGDFAFRNCSGLSSITIPNTITTIGNRAFFSCSNLKTFVVPSSVTSIGNGPFHGCSNLESFSGKYSSNDRRCLIVDGKLKAFAPANLFTYSIPRTVTSIGDAAFCDCNMLNSVEIPNTVTLIEMNAFGYCI